MKYKYITGPYQQHGKWEWHVQQNEQDTTQTALHKTEHVFGVLFVYFCFNLVFILNILITPNIFVIYKYSHNNITHALVSILYCPDSHPRCLKFHVSFRVKYECILQRNWKKSILITGKSLIYSSDTVGFLHIHVNMKTEVLLTQVLKPMWYPELKIISKAATPRTTWSSLRVERKKREASPIYFNF